MANTLAGLLFGPSVDIVWRSMTAQFQSPHLIAKYSNLDVGIVRFALHDLLSVGLVKGRQTNGGEYAVVRDDNAFILKAVGKKDSASIVLRHLERK